MNDDKDIAPEEGAAFLKTLDDALAGRATEGPHAELAQFGAGVARAVNPSGNERSDPELRKRIEQRLSSTAAVPPTSSTSTSAVQSWMKRWRLGVLDLAALVIIGVLSVALYRGLVEKRPPDAIKPRLTVADGDSDNDKKVAPPTPPNLPAPGDADDEPAALPEAPEEPWKVELHRTLAQKITLELKDKTFSDAVNILNIKTKANCIIDPKIAAKGADKSAITFSASDMPAEMVLKWICRLADLSFDLRNQSVFISDKSTLGAGVSLQIYDVSEVGIPPGDLVTLIHDRIFPADFADSATSVAEANGKLVVMLHRDAHLGVLELLTALRRSKTRPEISLHRKAQPWVAELTAKLEKKVSFDFVDKPFDEAIDYLHTQSGVTFVIDPKLLAGGIPNLNLHVTDMSLKLASDWIGKLAGIEYKLEDQAVFVRAPQEDPLELRIYNVTDLIGNGGTANAISDLIRQRIRPDQWDAAKGTSIEATAGRLVVMQRPEIHALVHQLLEGFRTKPIKP